MINFEKLIIFKIEKAMKNEISQDKENGDERPYTFKITKRRSPWTAEEDEAITALVNKYGTGNWTLIANEMSNLYGFKSRSGKQCRERWHNHLDPSINKDYWTEKEENVLFMKHMEYGNKWSDIAKFLPGRTDNAIKNHFYSKLRKFIRKILKQINKDNLLKSNGVDPNKYNSDRVYKMIKKNKIPYNSLNKDSILTMIINFERNNKTQKVDSLLNKKTQRRKINKLSKENLYSEKVNKRYSNIPIEEQYPQEQWKGAIQTKRKPKNNIQSLYRNNINTRSHRLAKIENVLIEPLMASNIQGRSRRNIKRKNLKEDYVYENEEVDEENKYAPYQKENNNEENGKDLISRNLNIIINKSVLFKNFVKEEEERSSRSSSQSERKLKRDYNNLDNTTNKDYFLGQTSSSSTNPTIQPIPILNPILSSTPLNNVMMDDRMFRYDTYPYMDPSIPLISPINPNAKIYPPSTRNYFNIEMPFDGNYSIPIGYNLVPMRSPFNFVSTPTNMEKINFNQSYTPNKEVSMHNKILINDHMHENEDLKVERTITPQFKSIEQNSETENKNEEKKKFFEEGDQLGGALQFQGQNENKSIKKVKKPSIDMNLVNTSETGRIFTQQMANSFNVIKSNNNDISHTNEIPKPEISQNINKEIVKINKEIPTNDKDEERSLSNISDKSDKNENNDKNQIKRININRNTTNLSISPKSAFIKMK